MQGFFVVAVLVLNLQVVRYTFLGLLFALASEEQVHDRLLVLGRLFLLLRLGGDAPGLGFAVGLVFLGLLELELELLKLALELGHFARVTTLVDGAVLRRPRMLLSLH